MALSVVVGASKSRVLGFLKDEVVEIIRNATCYTEKNARFSEAFKKKRWDGKSHLFTERLHEFPTGILGRVCGLLSACGLDYEVVDHRDRSDKNATDYMPIKGIVLRPYQQQAVAAALEEGSGVLRVATGGGKTIIGSTIISELQRPAIFLVHRLDLMHQVLDVLRGTGCDAERTRGLFLYPNLVGQVGGGVYEPNVVTVMTVQTICAALGMETSNDEQESDLTGARAHRDEIVRCLLRAQVVMVDECHHVPADTVYEVLQTMANCVFRFGLSATDWRDDGADLLIEAALGKRLINISLSDLVKLGYLVPARIKMYDIQSEDTGWAIKRAKQQYNAAYAQFVVNNQALNEKVIEVNRRWHREGRTILTLVTAVKHGQRLCDLMNESGVRTVFLSGKDKVDFRKEVLNDIRSKTLRSLVATSIADEGLDLPALDAINLAGGGRSSTKVYQRIGRTLRPTPGKSEGLVADYYIHGDDWMEEHSAIRERMYKREPAFSLVGQQEALFA